MQEYPGYEPYKGSGVIVKKLHKVHMLSGEIFEFTESDAPLIQVLDPILGETRYMEISTHNTYFIPLGFFYSPNWENFHFKGGLRFANKFIPYTSIKYYETSYTEELITKTFYKKIKIERNENETNNHGFLTTLRRAWLDFKTKLGC